MRRESAIKSIEARIAGLRKSTRDGWCYGAGKPITDAACETARLRAVDSHGFCASGEVPTIAARKNGGAVVVLPAGQWSIEPDGSSESIVYDETEELFECFGYGCVNEVFVRGPIDAGETFFDGDKRCCVACGREVDPRPEFEPLTFSWVCVMVRINSREPDGDGSVVVDFGGAGTFERLVDGLRENRGDVWDCNYGYACLSRIIDGVYPAGAMPEEERWFRLECPGYYGDEAMTAVECERPASLPPKFVWALHAIGQTIDAGDPHPHMTTYDDAVRYRDTWIVRRAKRMGLQ